MIIPSNFRSQLQQPYDLNRWRTLLRDLLPPGSLSLLREPAELDVPQDKVRTTRQLGTLTLGDERVALLEVETDDQVQLARNRVGLRNFVARFIDEANAAAVLAVFHQPGSDDWRLTYASRRSLLDEDTFEITRVETAPRRFTFLLGPREPCRTPAERLALLRERGESMSLADLEKAFSVETLTKDFFKRYKLHYQAFVDELLSAERAESTRRRFGLPEGTDGAEQEKADKPVRDFVKTLMGRLVFLHFLQKKGWLGCSKGSRRWTDGDPNFLWSFFELATSNGHAELFHSRYLGPLFFEALNRAEREGDLFPLTDTRLPYLNGGLFEEDRTELREIDFPPKLFEELLSFFGEYNFTIDENDPEDHEVGIDPEMLGHIFENLLEDNKDKGAFYTPKAIVSYMARQSLLHYLQTHLGEHPELKHLLDRKEIPDQSRDSFVVQNAKRIADLLQNVKICDPAIGSGAFPIGLLQEILWTRLALNLELNEPAERARLKREIIQNSIHGVDIDPGAIEIARLRFWLALVVDEDEPRPLPNLDYKIHRADSLIEMIRGEDATVGIKATDNPSRKDLIASLVRAKTDLFNAQHKPEKRAARLAFYRALSRIAQDEFTMKRAEEGGLFGEGDKVFDLDETLKEFTRWVKRIEGVKGKKVAYQEHLLAELRDWFEDPEHPTFLWTLHFGEVFARGGFDIVIANPPYVRHETISAYAPRLKQRYEVAASRADLFIFFYEQSVKLLKPGGVLTFITSNKYFRAAYGKKLRPFLKRQLTLQSLVDFGDAPVFDAIAYASILIGNRTPAPPDHRLSAYNWRVEDEVSRISALLDEKAFPLRQSQLTDQGWQLEPPEVMALLRKLREGGKSLGEYVGGEFYRGIITGLNEAFVLTNEQREALIAEDPKSAELIKPYLRGKDIKRWRVHHRDLYLIVFPFGFHKKLKDYPAILHHLEQFEEKLKNRGQCKSSRSGKGEGQHHWLELDNNPKPEYLELHEAPKLLYPELASEPRFAFDTSASYADCTLYLVPTSDASLQSILNSAVTTWLICQISAVNRGGYVRFKKQYMEQIPIPPASETDKARLAELAEACAEAAKRDDKDSLRTLEAEIDRIVYRLFDLTPDEIRLIEEACS